MRSRTSRPFGRPSPPASSKDALGGLRRMIDDRVKNGIETSVGIRTSNPDLPGARMGDGTKKDATGTGAVVTRSDGRTSVLPMKIAVGGAGGGAAFGMEDTVGVPVTFELVEYLAWSCTDLEDSPVALIHGFDPATRVQSLTTRYVTGLIPGDESNPRGENIQGLAWSSDGMLFGAASLYQHITAIDPRSASVAYRIELPMAPNEMASGTLVCSPVTKAGECLILWPGGQYKVDPTEAAWRGITTPGIAWTDTRYYVIRAPFDRDLETNEAGNIVSHPQIDVYETCQHDVYYHLDNGCYTGLCHQPSGTRAIAFDGGGTAYFLVNLKSSPQSIGGGVAVIPPGSASAPYSSLKAKMNVLWNSVVEAYPPSYLGLTPGDPELWYSREGCIAVTPQGLIMATNGVGDADNHYGGGHWGGAIRMITPPFIDNNVPSGPVQLSEMRHGPEDCLFLPICIARDGSFVLVGGLDDPFVARLQGPFLEDYTEFVDYPLSETYWPKDSPGSYDWHGFEDCDINLDGTFAAFTGNDSGDGDPWGAGRFGLLLQMGASVHDYTTTPIQLGTKEGSNFGRGSGCVRFGLAYAPVEE